MGTVDIGADEFTGIHSLEADVFALSEAAGGKVSLTLNGDGANAGRDYVMVGAVTGTNPGNALPGGMIILPLNWDLFTDFVIAKINSSIFSNFMGALDLSGKSLAVFDTLGTLPPGMAGVYISFAYAVGRPWDFASNPINVEVVP